MTIQTVVLILIAFLIGKYLTQIRSMLVRLADATAYAFSSGCFATMADMADGTVEAFTCDLPATSTYALHLSVDGEVVCCAGEMTQSTSYCAGEYLVLDNGVWSNVYLTSFARGLMGHFATHVIALNPAIVRTAENTTRTWHYATA